MASPSLSDTVYRFQDDKGRWHFTDKKPKRQHETLEVLSKIKKKAVPEILWRELPDQQHLIATNPWHAPVQFEIWHSGKRFHHWVTEAVSEEPVPLDSQRLNSLGSDWEYRYRLGRPITKGDGAPLRPPVPSSGRFRITQGFKGAFSHSKEPSLYAIDIAMSLSEQVHAVRDGIVVTVKDDYHMGGTDRFFLDKANFVIVLHSDDTYAVYAHILLGSALVREGQRVAAGDALANAGTSGYSTGPHLHFVLRHNTGDATASAPFVFTSKLGVIQPIAQLWLSNQE